MLKTTSKIFGGQKGPWEFFFIFRLVKLLLDGIPEISFLGSLEVLQKFMWFVVVVGFVVDGFEFSLAVAKPNNIFNSDIITRGTSRTYS